MAADFVLTPYRRLGSAELDAFEGERDRLLLLMREEGFSYREISETVGVKEGSVGTLLSRAQKRFVTAYESRSPETTSMRTHDAIG